MIDDEVESVVMAVLRQSSAAGEQAVGVVRSGAGAHEDLSHVLEMAGVRQPLRLERFGRPFQVGEQERVDEPRNGVSFLRGQFLEVACQRRRLGRDLSVEVTDVCRMRVKVVGGKRVAGVRRVPIAKLQRLTAGLNPVPEDAVRQPRAGLPVRSDVLASGTEPDVKEVLLLLRISAERATEGEANPPPMSHSSLSTCPLMLSNQAFSAPKAGSRTARQVSRLKNNLGWSARILPAQFGRSWARPATASLLSLPKEFGTPVVRGDLLSALVILSLQNTTTLRLPATLPRKTTPLSGFGA